MKTCPPFLSCSTQACTKHAEYDSPRNYCVRCWIVWFGAGQLNEQDIKRDLAFVRRQNKKDGIKHCKKCKRWH